MSTSKGAHYAHTLDLARRLGLQDHPAPAHLKGSINLDAVGSTASPASSSHSRQDHMDWNELLRKFRKHNPTKGLTAQAALVERLIRAVLPYSVVSEATTSTGQAPPRTLPPLPPLLPSPSQPAVLSALDALEDQVTSNSSKADSERDSAKVVLAYGRYVTGRPQLGLEVLDGISRIEREPAGEAGEAYDLTLRVFEHFVRGVCLESLQRPLDEVRQAYRLASQAYEAALESLAAPSKPNAAKDDLELHRVGETALYRLCSVDRVISSPHHAFSSHLSYVRHANMFRTTITPPSRSHLAYPRHRALPIHRHFRSLSLETGNASHASLNDRAEEAVLRSETTLPRAGGVNARYLTFLDEVVDAWRKGGCKRERAPDVVEILYNALTHTFQSQRLLRYLVRTLTVSERYNEARKALKLYVELWDKARETDAKQVAREMKELRAKAGVNGGSGPQSGGGGGTGAEKLTEKANGSGSVDEEVRSTRLEEDEHDVDSDLEFLETGAFGVRLLCRYVGDPKEGLALANRMKAVWDEQRDAEIRGRQDLEGKVELSLGIALGSLAAKEANPEKRPSQHASALSHLETAVALSPSSYPALFALSYQLFELRQVSRALEVARQAVSIDKAKKEGWHLLGLLVSAQKDMKAALQVFETALDLDAADDVDADKLDGSSVGTAQAALAKLEGSNASASSKKIEEAWDYPTTETERLGVEVELRMSKNVVIEYLEGPAAALADQQEMLGWFANAYGPVAESIAATSPPLPPPDALTSSTDGLSKRKSLIGRRVSLRSKKDSNRTSTYLSPTSASTSTTSPAAAAGTHSPLSRSAAQTPVASAAPSRTGSAVNLSTAGTVPPAFASSSTSTTMVPSPRSKLPTIESNPTATRMLCGIWLASAASFRRAGKLDEARGAVCEAEKLGGDWPEVWSQLAQIYVAKGDVAAARLSLQKAFSFEVDHLPSLILFSRLYLAGAGQRPQPPSSSATRHDDDDDAANRSRPSRTTSWVHAELPFAETLLSSLTKRHGWDSPEAWFELSQCYKHTERARKEKECLVWALQLEETKACRPLDAALDRVV
ncbi:hypothetical protein JCM10212_000544 [Sporobolomyces blumeae]